MGAPHTIERGASGGSFFTIPPQIQVEIAARKKIITDEHSGRVLIDSTLAEEERKKLSKFRLKDKNKNMYAVKEAVFPFNKFPNVDVLLGPEMKSTGESILFIDSLKDDAFYELYSRRKMYLSK